MLTMTCNLVQKGVIHSVTVMGKKGICVLLWGAEAEAPGRAGSRQAGHRASECSRVSPRVRAALSGASRPSVQSSGPPQLHRRLSVSAPPHLLLTEPRHLVNVRFSVCPSLPLCEVQCSPQQGSAHPLLRWLQVKLVRKFPHNEPEVVREFIYLVTFSLDSTVEILSMKKENKSCDSQLWMSSKFRWRLLEIGPGGSTCPTEPSTFYK